MSSDIFEGRFRQWVEPVLFGFGFREVRAPEGWMAPAKLLEFENRWFGASWDPRDMYLEVAVGRLFRFRDVLPRVIVRGHYHYNVDCTSGETIHDLLTKHLMRVGQEVPIALDQFEQRLAAALEADQRPPERPTKKGRRVFAEYAVRLGTRSLSRTGAEAKSFREATHKPGARFATTATCGATDEGAA